MNNMHVTSVYDSFALCGGNDTRVVAVGCGQWAGQGDLSQLTYTTDALARVAGNLGSAGLPFFSKQFQGLLMECSHGKGRMTFMVAQDFRRVEWSASPFKGQALTDLVLLPPCSIGQSSCKPAQIQKEGKDVLTLDKRRVEEYVAVFAPLAPALQVTLKNLLHFCHQRI